MTFAALKACLDEVCFGRYGFIDDGGEQIVTPEPAPKKHSRPRKAVDENSVKQNRRYSEKQKYKVSPGSEVVYKLHTIDLYLWAAAA